MFSTDALLEFIQVTLDRGLARHAVANAVPAGTLQKDANFWA